MNGRKRRLVKNTFSSLMFQIVTIVCGFILPRLILKYYGSETNGLVSSIQQFLQIIAFLELGVGAVVKSSLYKPLAEHDNVKISEILASANKFFRRLAGLLLIYVILLTIVYPLVADNNESVYGTAFLIVAMSISYFAQYYFGIVNQLLLTADQKGYIQYNTQTITLIVNTIACSVLIVLGASIQVVKLVTSVIFLIRPIVYKIYVDRHYSIDRKISYEGEPIQQKWNGVAQHVAAIVLDSTDIVVLTLFSTLTNVSIYYVYHLVVYGVKQLFVSMTNGIQSLLGELWAKQEIENLKSMFGWVEWCIHTGGMFLFGCTAFLILPFVQVYTKGINDANYILPLFAFLITLAHAVHCLRIPYNTMILAAGHYKQTQSNYIIAASINVIVSIVTVKAFGLIGVAIGTLVAMAYQAVWMAWYISKHLIKWPIKNFIKQLIVDAITIAVAYLATHWIHMSNITYLSWIVMAVEIVVVVSACIIVVNFIFYKDRMFKLLSMGKRMINRII